MPEKKSFHSVRQWKCMKESGTAGCPDIEAEDIKTLLRSEPLSPLLDEAVERTREMAEEYHQRALDILEAIDDTELKSLLYRLTAKILK